MNDFWDLLKFLIPPTMASYTRTCLSRIPPLYRCSSLSSSILLSPSLTPPFSAIRGFNVSASISTQDSSQSANPHSLIKTTRPFWKPMCLYYTQGKCTLVSSIFSLSSIVSLIVILFRIWQWFRESNLIVCAYTGCWGMAFVIPLTIF